MVEGKRSEGKVRQRTLSYLGPVPSLALGIPLSKRRKVESKIGQKINWNKILEQIRAIPLTLNDLSEIRRNQYALAVRARNLELKSGKDARVTPSEIFAQRNEGELTALAKLSARGFQEIFEKVDDQTYRMRL